MNGRPVDGTASHGGVTDHATRGPLALASRVVFLIATCLVLLALGLGMATAGLYLVLDSYFTEWLAALLTALACITLAVGCLLLARGSVRRRGARSLDPQVAKDVVRDHPLGSAAAALGAGLLLGYTDRSRQTLAEP